MKKIKFKNLAVMILLMLFAVSCTPKFPNETDESKPETSETAARIEETDTTEPNIETEEESESAVDGSESESATESDSETAEPDVPLSEVVLIDPATSGPIEGAGIAVDGRLVTVKVPLLFPESALKAAKVGFKTADGTVIEPKTTDLTSESFLEVPDGEGNTVTCIVRGARESFGLPLLEINTDGGEKIVEKNTYIHGTLSVDGKVYQMKIKGRGNASWNTFPKKSYRIKLDEGASVLGLTKNRDWVLTSNYADKSLIRNCVAHAISASLSGIEYTPTHIPVNLYLNGQYLGVYTFGDKIEDGKGRLDLGEAVYGEKGLEDVGFLVEIGWDFDEENDYNKDYFDSEIVYRIFIKEPEILYANTPEFLSLKNYILSMERAVMSNSGWEEYIDVDSWIDWLIVNELTFNTESSFYRSCYLWRPVGGKLKMGPVWDFDMAFGNHYGDLPKYDGWCTTESTYQYLSTNWMNYLMTYPEFTDRLVKRWNEVKDGLLDTALSAVDKYSLMLDGSQQVNFKVWDIMNVGVGMGSVDRYLYNTYDKQVQYLRDFINTRWKYIDNRLNSDEYAAKQ